MSDFIRRHTAAIQVGLGLTIVLVLLSLGYVLFADHMGYFANVYAEALGMACVIVLLDRIMSIRRTQQERLDLALQMGSPNRSVAVEAARIIWAKGWHSSGLLRGKVLVGADLRRAYLYQADLRSANMFNVDLRGADLYDSDLTACILKDANMEGASLRKARMWGANLAGANLLAADLRDASLDAAVFDDDTVLPDGSTWTPGRDLGPFLRPDGDLPDSPPALTD